MKFMLIRAGLFTFISASSFGPRGGGLHTACAAVRVQALC